MMIYNNRKLSALLIAVLFHGVALSSVSQARTALHEEPSAVVFRIIARENTVCLGSSLRLEIELRNDSKRALRVQPNGISGVYSSTTRPAREQGFPEHANHYDLFHPLPSDKQPPTVMLLPGRSHRRLISLPLSDDFYRTDGIYRLSLSYSGLLHASKESANTGPTLFTGSLDSNEIIFEIQDCK